MRNSFVVEVVNDGRDNFRLVNFYIKDQVHMMPGRDYYDLPDEFFFNLRHDVMNGKKIVIKKKLLQSGKFSLDDFQTKKITKFQEEKQALSSKLRNKVAGLAIATSFFEIYEFIAVTGMLASQGVFLTDENREETYLNIINTGDETLINALERYLDIKDNMDKLFYDYKSIVDYMRRIERTESPEELKAVKETWGR
jgi:hypothetical protein